MSNWWARLRHWMANVLDDSLPMPPEQRDAREWTPEPDPVRSDRRKSRLRLHMLEKRGKGGYR